MDFAIKDVDGENLQISAKLETGEQLPDWIKFNSSTMIFTGKAPKDKMYLNIQLSILDEYKNELLEQFTIEFHKK